MSRFLEYQKSHIAIVIIKYKVVHTGPNTQSGGLNTGLFNNEYHGSLYFIVARLPTNDAAKVKDKNKIKVKNLFLIMLLIYTIKYE